MLTWLGAQVLEKALSDWDIAITPLEHPDMKSFRRHPTNAAGYICNLRQHWFTLRPINGEWWDLNSLLPAPAPAQEGFIDVLMSQMCIIYVVRGWLPEQPDPKEVFTERNVQLWTPEQVT
jgi:hypothetical protein